jgi:outer membrane protein assembly complex protein YaeT
VRALLLLAALAAWAHAQEVTVEITGNEGVPTSRLRTAASRGIGEYLRTRRPADAADAAWSMEGAMQLAGYAHAKVSFRIEGDTLRFVVDEGPRAYLGRVRLLGVRQMPEAKVRNLYNFPGSGLLGTERPLYRAVEVAAAASEIERLYLLNGFHDVRVSEPRIRWNDERTLADVTVRIEEGRRYIVAAVEVQGFEDAPVAGFVGQPFHIRTPFEISAMLRRLLYDQGHQFAEIDSSHQTDEKTALVTVRLVVRKGPLVRLRNLEITGAEKTSDRFLRWLVPLKKGDVLYQELIDRARENLLRSTLFSKLTTDIERVGDDQLDVRVTLEERKARYFDFEAGYGSYELFRGAIRYNDENLFGWGRQMRIGVHGSLRGGSADITIGDPWILGDRNRLEFIATAFYREEPSFDRVGWTAGLTVVRTTQKGWRLRTGYLYRNQDARNNQLPLPPEFQDEFVATAELFVSARFDRTDDILAPTRGWLVEGTVAYNAKWLGSDREFWDLALRGSWYINLGRRNVFAIGGSAQTRPVTDGGFTLPIQERLFLGGDNTVRSFDRDELGPNLGGVPTGGLTRVFFSAELRTQIWGDLFSGVFYDAGWVSLDSFDYTGPLGQGFGVGLRYMLPIGPIRIDFAYNPGELFAATQRWQIHLSVGFSF